MTESNTQLNQISATEEQLSNLGPGCYVKILDGDRTYWTEIVKINDENITAVVHPELDGNSPCNTCVSSSSAVSFGKQHIVDLGCDNYCWC